ncbi:MAG: serine hydrolase [Taibaiella sp.]|nr:serine hydrolase [Taibaiella sp.]
MLRLVYLFVLIFSCVTTNAQVGEALPVATAESRGYSAQFLKNIGNEAAKEVPDLGAFLVWKHDALIYEGYFHGTDRSSVFNIKSASKSILSAIAGAAQMRGLLPDVNATILSILPEYTKPDRHAAGVWFAEDVAEDDSIARTLTLRHLLTMQTGWEWNDFGPICQAFIYSSDPVRFALDLEYAETPGTRFNYCTAGTHVFAVALAKLIHTDLKRFADSTIFTPAGITLRRWNTDAMSRYIGGCDMFLTPQDMMRFGLLYLKKGKLNGRQILSESWIKESLAKHAELKYWDVLPGANGYGYYWWRRISNGHQVYVASGVCGQLICIIPDVDMVITTASGCTERGGRSEIKKLHLLMDKIIVAAK